MSSGELEMSAMTLGSRLWRHSASLALLMVAAGCNSVPISQFAAAPNRPRSALAVAGRAALLPATVALDDPAELASIEPSAAGVGAIEMSPGVSDPSRQALGFPPPPPTPLLDAALERANASRIEEIASQPLKAAEAPLLPARLPPPPTFPDAPRPPEPVAEAKVEEPPRPEEVWRDGVRKLVGLTKAKVDQSGDQAGPWPLRSKVMAWLAEPDIDPDFGPREPDPVRSILKVLEASPPRGDHIRSAVQAIEEKAPLEVVDLKVCLRVRGLGDYDLFDPPTRKVPVSVIVYCEVDGLHHEQTSSGFRTRLAGHVEIVAEAGGPPVMARPLGTVQETCRRRRRDFYVPYVVELPPNLNPGEYRLRVQLTDLVANRSSSRDVAFSIVKE